MIRCIANCVAETSAQLIIREQKQRKGAQAKHNPDKNKHSEAHILVYVSNTQGTQDKSAPQASFTGFGDDGQMDVDM